MVHQSLGWPEVRAIYSVEKDAGRPISNKPRLGKQVAVSAKKADKAFERSDAEMFDAQFCPFQPLDQPPVFALVTLTHIVIGEMKPQSQWQGQLADDTPYSIHTIIHDADLDSANCCCAWALDENDDPVICVAGTNAVIKVYTPDGTLARTSPADPHLIASASKDVTIRMWSLNAAFKEAPCVCIYGSDTHCDDLLTIAFHKTGKWLLSAGKDMVVALWAVPAFPASPGPIVKQILAPQFSSSEIHNAIIDCPHLILALQTFSVAFWGDIIVSRDCHEGGEIVVWRIEGFSSSNPLPADAVAPFSHEPDSFSRSAFASSVHSNAGPFLWHRLFKLAVPFCDTQFFMRFGIFSSPEDPPHLSDAIFGFCDANSLTSFWNFRHIIQYCDYFRALQDAAAEKTACKTNGTKWKPETPGYPLGVKRPSWLSPIPGPNTAQAKASSGLSRKKRDSQSLDGLNKDHVDFLEQFYSHETATQWEGMYDVSNPLRPLQPHWQCLIKGQARIGRQVAWSPSGQWCIVAMNRNTACFMERVPVESSEDSP
ncbi:WD domain-containing protein [Ceratocystis lukuohia]|uniref:WD domain-containing protein n=1 Tax=Ceratocystis lukuohia TaxID=2019550 RepID=A0ABR4MM30_9PEZI